MSSGHVKETIDKFIDKDKTLGVLLLHYWKHLLALIIGIELLK